MIQSNLAFTQTGGTPQQQYTLRLGKTQLYDAIEKLNTLAGNSIAFDASLLENYQVGPLEIRDLTLPQILDQLLAGKYLKWKTQNNHYLIQSANRIFRPDNVTLNEYTFSGFVEDADSKERLPNTTILIDKTTAGAISNNYGYFSLSSNQKHIHVQVQIVGYQPLDTIIDLSGASAPVVLKLFKLYDELEGFVVSHTKEEATVTNEKISVRPDQMQLIPKLFGETDIFRYLYMLPGIRQAKEGDAGFVVRGGNTDQNLTLLDGANIYAPHHLLGISNFNNNIVKHVNVYKGYFSAKYGSRLSSIVDVVTRDGHMKQFHGDFSLGLLTSQLTLEGPIIKDKTTFILGARRTYWDWILGPAIEKLSDELDKVSFHYYDINLKVQHRFSDRDRIFLNFLNGQDRYGFKENGSDNNQISNKTEVNWYNRHYTLKWNHNFKENNFSNLMLFHTNFLLKSDFSGNLMPTIADIGLQSYSGIKDYGFNWDLEQTPGVNHKLSYGLFFNQHLIQPWQNEPGKTDLNVKNVQKSTEWAAYLEDHFQYATNMNLRIGLRYTGFFSDHKFYHNLQPRLNFQYQLKKNWAIDVNYSRMVQYLHQLNQQNSIIPSEIWISSTAQMRPQTSDQVSLSLGHSTEQYTLRIDPYYKWMYALKNLKMNAILDNSQLNNLDKIIDEGKGNSYGIELYLEKKGKILNASVSYTLAKSNRQFDSLNNGKAFPYQYDRRHDLKANMHLKLDKHWSTSLSWFYQSALPYTLPTSWIEHVDQSNPNNQSRQLVPVYGAVNNVRLRDYHRLDWTIQHKRKRRWWTNVWSISIYNVYGRNNPVIYYLKPENNGTYNLAGISYFGFIPSISYGINF